jgi:hypothetical protein
MLERALMVLWVEVQSSGGPATVLADEAVEWLQ